MLLTINLRSFAAKSSISIFFILFAIRAAKISKKYMVQYKYNLSIINHYKSNKLEINREAEKGFMNRHRAYIFYKDIMYRNMAVHSLIQWKLIILLKWILNDSPGSKSFLNFGLFSLKKKYF